MLVGVFKMKGSWVQSVKKIDTVVSDDVLFALEDDLSSRVLLNEPPGYSPSIQQQQQQTNSNNKKRGKYTRANQRQYINEAKSGTTTSVFPFICQILRKEITAGVNWSRTRIKCIIPYIQSTDTPENHVRPTAVTTHTELTVHTSSTTVHTSSTTVHTSSTTTLKHSIR